MALYVTANPTQLGSADPAATGASVLIDAATLTDTCDAILDREGVEDGQGTFTEAWVTIALDVPCTVEKGQKGLEKTIGAAEIAVGNYWFHLPLGTPMEPSYVLIKGGQAYDVVDFDAGITSPIKLTVATIRLWNWPVS